MSDRISQKDLEELVLHINKITGNPIAPYLKDQDGKFHSQIGNYHLDYAYGGVNLVQMSSEGGGIRCPINGGGFYTKRELYEKLNVFIRGIEVGKNEKL